MGQKRHRHLIDGGDPNSKPSCEPRCIQAQPHGELLLLKDCGERCWCPHRPHQGAAAMLGLPWVLLAGDSELSLLRISAFTHRSHLLGKIGAMSSSFNRTLHPMSAPPSMWDQLRSCSQWAQAPAKMASWLVPSFSMLLPSPPQHVTHTQIFLSGSTPRKPA